MAIARAFILIALLAGAQAPLPVAEFRSIELHGGGQVTVRQGAAQSVTLIEGNRRDTRIGVAGGRLVIDNCPERCPRGYRLQVEIVTPSIAALSVLDGGSIRTQSGFPAQPTLAASVSNGGAIDVRSLAVLDVTASVAQGGLVFTRPGRSLTASVAQGGRIAYWGGARVTSSIRGGGVVERGAAADADRPLADLHPRLPSLPDVPPLPDPRD